MADHFLTKTSILPSEFRKTGAALVMDRHAELELYLNQIGRAEIATLFATPMVGQARDGGAVNVSWYSDYRGDPRSLVSLDGAMREDVASRLAEMIATLKGVAAAPETEPDKADLIRASLSVRGAEDVLVVGGHPVLINWATAPAPAMASPDALAAHFNATLGAMDRLARVPSGPAAAVPPAAPRAVQATVWSSEAAAARQPNRDHSGGSGTPPSVATAGGAPRRILWWPPVVLILLMALLLVWLLYPGTRLFPPSLTPVEREISEGSLEVARQVNRDLEERALALETALEGAVCTPEGDLLVPGGRTSEGLLPLPPDAEDETVPRDGIVDPLVPPTPGRVQGEVAPGQEEAAENLLGVIEPRTVLVLVSSASGVNVGTGFFITPDTVATNYHVVADAVLAGDVYVVNESLGRPLPATILAYDGPFVQEGADFALLHVAGVSAPFFALARGDQEIRGQAVTAAGYPTDIIADDQRFQRLMEGISTEPPDLVVTNGIVNTEQQVTDDISILVHSASISRGNSGGPLVDLCGRVVGINTFISTESFRNLNLAQSIASFDRFLAATTVTPTYSSEACTPVVRPPTALPHEAAPETEPAPETDAEPATEAAPAEEPTDAPAAPEPEAASP